MAITLTANIDCPHCGAVADTDFLVPDADTREDIVDIPETSFVCPARDCGRTSVVQYPGWTFATEAG